MKLSVAIIVGAAFAEAALEIESKQRLTPACAVNPVPLTLMRHAKAKTWVRIDGFVSPDELASEYRKTTPK